MCIRDSIATLGEGAKLVMELTFDKGRGYVPAERNKQAIIEKNDINTLPVDSIYTPVLKVNYNCLLYTSDVYKRQARSRAPTWS